MTGSAHCALAPYWFNKRGKLQIQNQDHTEATIADRTGSVTLVGYQASARGGIVHVALSDCGSRVLLSGASVTVIKSKLLM